MLRIRVEKNDEKLKNSSTVPLCRFSAGFKLDDVSTAMEEIDKTGSGGNFMTSKQTLTLFRNAYYNSPIFPRLSLENWQAQGSLKAVELLRKYTRELIEGLTAPEDHGDLVARGEAFINRLSSCRNGVTI